MCIVIASKRGEKSIKDNRISAAMSVYSDINIDDFGGDIYWSHAG